MKEIETLYTVGGTVKTRTYRAKEIKMQMNGPQSQNGSIVNLWGNPDGVIAVMFQHAQAFELREIKDYSGENENAESATYESTGQEPSSIKA